MDKITKIILALLFLLMCTLCYFCHGWYSYKTKYKELQQTIERQKFHQETLTPLDLMVLSGDSLAYNTCNLRYMNHLFIGHQNDTAILRRDYLLYCYIFALRDRNSYAASDFSDYYLDDLNNGKIELDVAMLATVANMAKQVLSDTCNKCVMSKYYAADCLKKIYSGIYIEDLKDTIMANQYADSASKYMNQRWP